MKVGGDVTYRRMTMAFGGRWANHAGQEMDVLDILAAKGFNLARIRIYNQPGNVVNYNGTDYRLQSGWQDLADAVENAKAARARDMTLFISLHYSDFWTNPAIQRRPNAWVDYDQAQLEQATYDFTHDVMGALKDAGVTPEYISLGNEINNEIMDVGRSSDPSGYYGLLEKGIQVVRAVSPSTQTVIHLTDPDRGVYTSWLDGASTYGLEYDVMGISLYPFWTDMSISQMADFATWAGEQSHKPVMVCEVGYPWTLQTQHAGEITMIVAKGLKPGGPENYGATEAGQLRYMREYFRAMYNTGKVVGIAYWDPIWIDLDGHANGWVVGDDVEVEDTTFFDYQDPHRALSSLDAFNTW
jgi:arabinogalactan endo-1,4-beta-galactosidase